MRTALILSFTLLLGGCANPCPFPNSFLSTWFGAKIAEKQGRDPQLGARAGCLAARFMNSRQVQ
ncbi:MAG: hypothetical protein QF858_03845 [Candidatus Pacebacteria bacterium]|jgi:hypothetical protein|nr:hypothetical protein [bacterium]MDP6527976.1 hypothetical protein [Candidatus Paceibacterota bacterium]|tara:strand:+ start:4944 stop:5135 length:192 start_codon:yes stop_codon:yes gene_type:complete